MREFDVVAYSPTHFILNQTKTTPTIADAEAFVALLPLCSNSQCGRRAALVARAREGGAALAWPQPQGCLL